MPYKDKQAKREYQRIWVAERRAKYLKDKTCAWCMSGSHLEVDHIDRNKKWKHRFWSYCWAKIEAELTKCQILCHDCHMVKTMKELGKTEEEIYKERGSFGCCCYECRGVEPMTVEEWHKKRLDKDD